MALSHHHRRRCSSVANLVSFILLTVVISSVLGSIPSPQTRSHVVGSKTSSREDLARRVRWQRQQLVIGSSPPSCDYMRSCEGCQPCNRILVVIPHRYITPTSADEYYPLVWKCTCGAKIFD